MTPPTSGSAERVSELTYHIEPSFPPHADQFDIVDSNGTTLAWRLNAEQAQAINAALQHRRLSQGAGLTDEQRKAIEWAAIVAEDCARDVATWPNAPTVSDSAKRAAILRALSHPQPSQASAQQALREIIDLTTPCECIPCQRIREVAQKGLAQPSQGACDTCKGGGKRKASDFVEHWSEPCPDCNGTGQRGGEK